MAVTLLGHTEKVLLLFSFMQSFPSNFLLKQYPDSSLSQKHFPEAVGFPSYCFYQLRAAFLDQQLTPQRFCFGLQEVSLQPTTQ